MDNSDIVSKLINIANQSYSRDNMINLRYEILDSSIFIKEHIPDKLYDRLETEIECCYNELEYESGEGEYSERVYNDCVEVLKEVIEVLTKI